MLSVKDVGCWVLLKGEKGDSTTLRYLKRREKVGSEDWELENEKPINYLIIESADCTESSRGAKSW